MLLSRGNTRRESWTRASAIHQAYTLSVVGEIQSLHRRILPMCPSQIMCRYVENINKNEFGQQSNLDYVTTLASASASLGLLLTAREARYATLNFRS